MPGDEDHTMQALIYAAMAAATMGVDVGWQPAPDGGLEYIIQIEPETLEQLRNGQELAVGIRPELRDVRRYRIIVGDGPLPREALRPAAANYSAESDVGEAAPAVATENANPYRSPSYSGTSEAARPDLLAQSNTSTADPINSRYGNTGTSTPRFSTPSRYNSTPDTSAAETGTPSRSQPAPSANATTNPQAYDWFSERFGGAGSINVPLLYTTTESTNANSASNASGTNTNSEGWSSTNPNGSNAANGNNANGETPITGLPNPPSDNPRYGNNSSNTNGGSTSNTGNTNSGNYYGNDPRYTNNGGNQNNQPNNSGPALNPPNDTGLSPVNRPTNGQPANNWPQPNTNPNYQQPQPNYGNYAGNPYGGNPQFPVAPAPSQPTQQNPYAAGNPYTVGTSPTGQYPNQYQQPQSGGQQSPNFSQGTLANNGATGVNQTNASGLAFGQGTALDPNRPGNAPQQNNQATQEQESKPWAFLMMALFGLFASMGLNLYLGWNFYDARLRYLDLLDSLRRRGNRTGGSGLGSTAGRIGGDVSERYSAA